MNYINLVDRLVSLFGDLADSDDELKKFGERFLLWREIDNVSRAQNELMEIIAREGKL